jgi:hypothetical protein
MNTASWVLTVLVMLVLAWMGLLRPTGLASRSKAEREEDAQRDLAAKWLKKDAEKDPPA